MHASIAQADAQPLCDLPVFGPIVFQSLSTQPQLAIRARSSAYDAAVERVNRLAESVEVLEGLFAVGPFTHHGRYYDIDNLDSFPKPVQQPHPPILIADARRRMLSVAARQADVVALQAVSTSSGDVVDAADARLAERVAEQVGRVREAAGDRLPNLELCTSASVLIAEDRMAAAAEMAHSRAWHGISPEEVLEMPSIFIGSLAQVISLFLERRAHYGLSYFVASDTAIDTLSPIVDRLSGS